MGDLVGLALGVEVGLQKSYNGDKLQDWPANDLLASHKRPCSFKYGGQH